MKRYFALISVCFVLFFVFCGAPQAPTPGSVQSGVNVAYNTLTENELQRLIKVLPTFIDIVEKEGKDLQLDAKPGDIMSAFQGMSVLDKQISALDSRLRAAGMGWNEFWPAYAKTMLAFSAVLMDSLKTEAKQEMTKNEAEIKRLEARLNDPKVSDAEKKMIKASLDAMKSMTQVFSQLDTIYAKVPQINKDLVKKYMSTINNLLDRD
ncbi:MAG: hypothetical protein ABIL22_06365 [candidate division WOR-3 bacterium]